MSSRSAIAHARPRSVQQKVPLQRVYSPAAFSGDSQGLQLWSRRSPAGPGHVRHESSLLLRAGMSLSSSPSSSSEGGAFVSPEVSMQLRQMGFTPVQICDASTRVQGVRPGFEELLSALLGQSEPRMDAALPASDGSLKGQVSSMGFSADRVERAVERAGVGASAQAIVDMLCNEQSSSSLGDTSAPQRAVREPWECSICFSEQDVEGWHCPEGHKFCAVCMQYHAQVVAFPRCPDVGCLYTLAEDDFKQLNIPTDRLEAFRQGQLQSAMESLASNRAGTSDALGTGTEQLIRCQREDCTNAVLMVVGTQPSRFECPCGAPSFCTQCRQSPYHFHAKCSEVRALRERWLGWLTTGRDRLRYREHANTARQQQVQALRDGIKRHEELLEDEIWKASNCRCCPCCRRPVQKLEGCDAMKCGQDAHGGNAQQGCGATFNWREARPYVKCVESRSLPKITSKSVAIRGMDAFHPFVHCELCSEPGSGMKGICFRCIHCPSFNVCSKCEEMIGSKHDASHVFDVLYEADFDWSKVSLPVGTRVRIVRRGTTLPPRLLGHSLEGTVGVIRSCLPSATGIKGDTRQYRILCSQQQDSLVPITHVEPIVASQAEFRKLAELVKAPVI